MTSITRITPLTPLTLSHPPSVPVFQVFTAVLLTVQLGSLVFTAKQHYDGEDVRPVDVFTPLILFATIVGPLLLRPSYRLFFSTSSAAVPA